MLIMTGLSRPKTTLLTSGQNKRKQPKPTGIVLILIMRLILTGVTNKN